MIHTVSLKTERDVVQARQRAREIAALLGFDNREQIRLATATSEMARNAFRYARNGKVQFQVLPDALQTFEVVVTDSGPGIPNLDEILEGRYRSETGMGLGIIGTRRLMDSFDIQTSASGTTVRLRKTLPGHAPRVTPALLQTFSRTLARSPESPYDEIERQNQELLKTLQELRERQEEMALLNRELEDTNRGVVALYAELDERADYLRRASEMKTSFLSNVSHEFRTPVNSIISLSRMLLERMDGDLTSEQQKQVHYIADSARTLSDLVNDLLDLAKVEAGKIKIKVKDFEVPELFGGLKGMLKPLLADNTSVELVFEDSSAIPTLHTDEGKVSQILRNFISNAIKFTQQGEVRVSARLTGEGNILFQVSDTGIGIAPEHHETIFQEFTQIENAFQARYHGTGLGLPLCRNLALLLGGMVWVESELGQGSKFYAEIPLVYSGEADVSQASPPVPAPEFNRPPVLLIEADQETFQDLETHFRKSEFQLIHAENLAKASQWLDRHMPEAIIFDLDGESAAVWDLLAAVGKKYKTSGEPPPVIVQGTADDQAAACSKGAQVFLKKPVAAATVLEELRRMTHRQEPCRLLLVDDNELSLYILRELLNRPWLDLIEARNGTDALEIVRHERLDGMLLDLLMPGMSGFDVLEQLRAMEQARKLPVVVYTSKSLTADEKQRLKALNAGVLPKADVATTLAPEVLLNSLARFGISSSRTA